MPSLRDYRDRIKSVKSTRKITSAMKMVAASKLRRAQEQAEASQPYAKAMASMLARVAANVVLDSGDLKLLSGTGSDQRHLLVVVSADRGLCGGFNGNLIKAARHHIQSLRRQGKSVDVICVGRKGKEGLRADLGSHLLHSFDGMMGKARIEFAQANEVTRMILDRFEAGSFDVCTLVYNAFESVLSQKPTLQQLIPFHLPEDSAASGDIALKASAEGFVSPYAFEPCEKQILEKLLPRNLGVQLYSALLDSAAGEQAARMTAMDNATRNAGDMIKGLTLQYNRARQAYITKELIEIISGAEAL